VTCSAKANNSAGESPVTSQTGYTKIAGTLVTMIVYVVTAFLLYSEKLCCLNILTRFVQFSVTQNDKAELKKTKNVGKSFAIRVNQVTLDNKKPK